MKPAKENELGDRYARYRSHDMLAGQDIRESPTDRQEKVPGYEQDAARRAGVAVVGAGGLTAAQLPAMARKGHGRFVCMDADVFDATNYSRQFCYADDLYQNKAICLARNLVKECIYETEIEAFAMPYQEARAYIDWDRYDIGLCNVDNNEVRQVFAEDLLRVKKPGVFCAVSDDANYGWVFIQLSQPGTPCFGCAFPDFLNDDRHPCPGTPATSDILRVIGGFVTYAVDSVLMERPRGWNVRYAFLAGFADDAGLTVKRREDCPLCGGTKKE